MTPEAEFWAWFGTNQAQLWNLPYRDWSQGAALRHQLDAVHPGLMWEIGVVDADTRDLVISADGATDVAPSVHRLVDAAPGFADWRITKFRPRREPDELERDGYRLVARDVRLAFASDPSKGPPYDVVVVLPDLTEANYDGLATLAMVILDGWLGEEFVMTRLRNFAWRPDSPNRSPHFFPLTEAPRAFGLE